MKSTIPNFSLIGPACDCEVCYSPVGVAMFIHWGFNLVLFHLIALLDQSISIKYFMGLARHTHSHRRLLILLWLHEDRIPSSFSVIGSC